MARAATMTAASRAGRKPARRAVASAMKPPPFRAVQLATLVDAVPSGSRWLHEMKYDGYRLLVAVGGGEARAYTRSGLDWSEKFDAIEHGITSVGHGLELGGDGLSAVFLETVGTAYFLLASPDVSSLRAKLATPAP